MYLVGVERRVLACCNGMSAYRKNKSNEQVVPAFNQWIALSDRRLYRMFPAQYTGWQSHYGET